MSIVRVNKSKKYSVMSNYHFKDKDLSLKAKGLLSLMFSLPEDWDYSINGLVSICKENESAITSTLKELKEHGYLVVTKFMPNQTDTGRIEYIYDIYETPKQEVEKQDLEFLGVEFQGVENHPLNNNTNNINTKELNTNNINKEKLQKENQIQVIFDYWNSKEIIVHRDLTDKRKRAIASAIKNNSVDDIKTAIDHYEEMLHSDYEYCDYPWSLEIFLGREKGFTEFLDDGYKWINYLKWKKNPNPKPTYNNPTYHNPKEVVKKKLTKFEEDYFAEQEKRFYEGK